jgi:hypothetical protein
VVVVGSNVPNIGATEQNILKGVFGLGLDLPSLLDFTNQTSLHELREVIALCDLVITVDSGVLHVANCTDTHVLAIFTDIDPRFRTRIRYNQPNAYTTTIHSTCEKQYCNHGMEAQANAFSLNINACAACRPWNKCSTRQRPFSATRRSRDAAWPTKKRPPHAGAVFEICCVGYFSAFLRSNSKLNEEKSSTLPESSTPKI